MFHYIEQLLDVKDNCLEASYELIRLLDIHIPKTTLKNRLEEHPDYPSLLSVADAYTSLGIESVSVKVDASEFHKVPVPFLTQITGENKTEYFTVVKESSDDHISFFDHQKHKWVQSSWQAFLKKWSGVILLAEPEEGYKETTYDEELREEKRSRAVKYLTLFLIPALAVAQGIAYLFQMGYGAISPFLFVLLTLTGVFVTVLLLWYEVDKKNSTLKQICTSTKNTNCGAILESKEAKIFGVSWSAIGFVFFSAELIATMVTSGFNSGMFTLLSLFTVAAAPYIVYSIYYQLRIAKQWCSLCLSVQAVLALQLILVLTNGWISNVLTAITTFQLPFTFAIAAALPVISISLLLPALKSAREGKEHTLKLKRLKNNLHVFSTMLSKQKMIQHSTDGLGILLGNRENAKYIITKVCNPYCGPCGRAHSVIDEILKNNPEVQVQIIFTATSDNDDIRAQPVRHLMAIAQKSDNGLLHQALDDWYLSETRAYATFSEKYPVNGQLPELDTQLDRMSQWCIKEKITATPTFFVNGYKLPDLYNIKDLQYLLH